MRRIQKTMLVVVPVALISACTVDPKDHETAPVNVESAKGTVTCQLYTDSTTVWDRAISVPASMSIQEGDAICKAEGARRQKNG